MTEVKRKRGRPRKNPQPTPSLSNSYSSLASSLSGNLFGETQLSQTDTIIKNNRYYMISNDRSTLSYMYTTHGVIQTLIDQPADDALRGGVEISSDELSPEDVQAVKDYMEEKNVLETVKEAIKWARLYGGAGIIINTSGNASQSLSLDSINSDSPLEFYAADLWELNKSTANQYGDDKPYLPSKKDNIPFNYYGKPLNKDRVLILKGKKAPSLPRQTLRGWGMSEVERVVRSVNQFLKNQNVVFDLIDEAKIDIYQISGLNQSLLTSDGTTKVTNRVQLSNQIKSYAHALVMDKEDSYEQKQVNFSGLTDIHDQLRYALASDLKMPVNKLWGDSASGFGSGEDSIENYNSMLEGEIRDKYRQVIVQMIQIICKKVLDFVPEGLDIDFKPLRILSAEQEENVKNSEFNRLLSLYDRGIITSEELISQSNISNLTPSSVNDDPEEDFPEPVISKQEAQSRMSNAMSSIKSLFKKDGKSKAA